MEWNGSAIASGLSSDSAARTSPSSSAISNGGVGTQLLSSCARRRSAGSSPGTAKRIVTSRPAERSGCWRAEARRRTLAIARRAMATIDGRRPSRCREIVLVFSACQSRSSVCAVARRVMRCEFMVSAFESGLNGVLATLPTVWTARDRRCTDCLERWSSIGRRSASGCDCSSVRVARRTHPPAVVNAWSWA